jgi:hypothetical protein
MRSALLILWSISLLQFFSSPTFAQEYQLGNINFEVSGDEVAMPYFEKGMLLLHNFEYEDAAQEFEMAQLLDPDLVMAYWGEAMCYNHPLWGLQNYQKGRGALYKLGVQAEERLEKARTELEKGFISSIEILYGEDADMNTRNEKYEAAMGELYADHADSEEVAAFYALSKLANAEPGEEEKLDEASRILMKLQTANPRHPGALNYLIHTFDAPDKAYKGRKAADTYFQLASDSKYALHAPSHIYLVAGEWDKYVVSNEAAWKAAEAWVKKNNKSLEDRDYHSLWWLQFGYLQQGRFGKALELLENMNRDARYSKSDRLRFHLAMMRGHYLSESGNWGSDVVGIRIPTVDFSVSVKNMCFFVDAMAALGKNDLPRVDWFLNQMTDQRMVDQNRKEPFKDYRTYSIEPAERTSGLERELILAEVMEWELQALKALKTNKLEEAESFIQKAVQLEEKAYYDPGPPVVLKPSHEIYGEILLTMNKSSEALEQFDLALQRAPNRSLSLLGKYRALKDLGETQKAAQIRKLLMENWKSADKEVMDWIN